MESETNKLVNTVDETAVENSNIDSLTYSGDVTVSVMQDNRVISTKKYHNNGCEKLFSFFTNCLAGEWNAAKSLRPCKIILFKKDDAEELYDPTTGEPKFDPDFWTSKQQVSTKVLHDNAVVMVPIKETKKGVTSTIGYAAKYHFRIPYLCLVDGAVVRKMGLFPGDKYTSTTRYADVMSAYFIFDSMNEYIEVPTGGCNYTIIVDWTLNIKNI